MTEEVIKIKNNVKLLKSNVYIFKSTYLKLNRFVDIVMET